MISGLANHLWQSSVFVAVTWLLTLLLRRNSAAARHGLWLAASVKFLVPLWLLAGLGSQVEWRRTPVAPQARVAVVERIGEPLLWFAAPAPVLTPRAASRVPAVLFSLWLCGFAVNVMAWWRRWRYVHAAFRAARPLDLGLAIPARLCSARLEPGVFGIFRPALLLPDGIRERLTPGQFEAIVAHELCHARRFDNLTSALHMVVEALFWFHPAVWWIQARLVEERERACDEAVLRSGGEPQAYAEGIVRVCEFYLESRLACVAGVTGANLKQRVEAIMRNRATEKIDAGKKMLLAAAGVAAVAGPLLAGAMWGRSMVAQEPRKPVEAPIAASALPAFEVASIKPSAPDAKLGVVFAPGGKLYVTNATLRFLIKIAYDIGDDQLAGGPGWIQSKRYDVEATPGAPLGGDPAAMTPDQILVFHRPVRLRLQRLLADRFQLELRKEQTRMPIFALVLAKGGPKLKATKSTGAPQLTGKFGAGVLNAVGVDMPTLARFLSEGQVGRPVVDTTALKSKYDFRLDWAPEPSPDPSLAGSAPSVQSADAGGLSIFTALQQQLGLKLEARTDAADRLVVVRAELATAN